MWKHKSNTRNEYGHSRKPKLCRRVFQISFWRPTDHDSWTDIESWGWTFFCVCLCWHWLMTREKLNKSRNLSMSPTTRNRGRPEESDLLWYHPSGPKVYVVLPFPWPPILQYRVFSRGTSLPGVPRTFTFRVVPKSPSGKLIKELNIKSIIYTEF